MRQSLIENIKKKRNLTGAIILTHNIDFVFLQLVVLPALRVAGHPKLTVFADARCAADTFSKQAPIIEGIGLQYRIVPILMKPGFRFHPKVLMLSEKERANLFIGSGNLTYGGWVENAEVWTETASDTDGTAHFAWFKQYLDKIIQQVPFPEAVQSEIDEAFDGQNHLWATNMDKPSGLVGKATTGDSILKQIQAAVGEKKIERITVCSPFFDNLVEAPQEISAAFGNPPTRILLQSRSSGLTKQAAAGLPENISLIPVRFNRKGQNEYERESYIHAKFYAFEYGDIVTVFAGSANCSRAGLLLPGSSGNAELMMIQTLPRQELDNHFLNEFQLFEGTPELVDQPDDHEEDFDVYSINITAASFELGELFIGYVCSPEITITRCIIDEKSILFEQYNKGKAIALCNWQPSRVQLEATDGENTILSNLRWIDHERELRSTARGRLLADTISIKVRPGYWGLSAWTEILDVFCKHIDYIPKFVTLKRIDKSKHKKKDAVEYTHEDVFAKGYGLGSLNLNPKSIHSGLRVKNIQQLLLKWFGYSTLDNDDEGEESANNDTLHNIDENNDGDEPVDRLHPIVLRKKIQQVDDNTEANRKRAKKFLAQLTDLMCSINYLKNRPPELLASDLKLMVVMLLTGKREKWIDEAVFIDCSQRIWYKLFLSSEPDPGRGWIEYRMYTSEQSGEFLDKLKSVELSAALAIWAMSLPFDFTTADRAVFSLCYIMSVARVPALWHGGSCKEIAEKLKSDLLFITFKGTMDAVWWNFFDKRWQLLTRIGHSVKAFEHAMGDNNPVDLKDKLEWSTLSKGELLWQGKKNYFCITLTKVERSMSGYTKAISLIDTRNPIEILPEYLIPVYELLRNDKMFLNPYFNDDNRKYIKALSKHIKKNIIAAGKNWHTNIY